MVLTLVFNPVNGINAVALVTCSRGPTNQMATSVHFLEPASCQALADVSGFQTAGAINTVSLIKEILLGREANMILRIVMAGGCG